MSSELKSLCNIIYMSDKHFIPDKFKDFEIDESHCIIMLNQMIVSRSEDFDFEFEDLYIQDCSVFIKLLETSHKYYKQYLHMFYNIYYVVLINMDYTLLKYCAEYELLSSYNEEILLDIFYIHIGTEKMIDCAKFLILYSSNRDFINNVYIRSYSGEKTINSLKILLDNGILEKTDFDLTDVYSVEIKEIILTY